MRRHSGGFDQMDVERFVPANIRARSESERNSFLVLVRAVASALFVAAALAHVCLAPALSELPVRALMLLAACEQEE